jgi:predicted transcriptional regulator
MDKDSHQAIAALTLTLGAFQSVFVVREMVSLIHPHRLGKLPVVENNELVGTVCRSVDVHKTAFLRYTFPARRGA